MDLLICPSIHTPCFTIVLTEICHATANTREKLTMKPNFPGCIPPLNSSLYLCYVIFSGNILNLLDIPLGLQWKTALNFYTAPNISNSQFPHPSLIFRMFQSFVCFVCFLYCACFQHVFCMFF